MNSLLQDCSMQSMHLLKLDNIPYVLIRVRISFFDDTSRKVKWNILLIINIRVIRQTTISKSITSYNLVLTHILIINSYHKGFQWSDELIFGIEKVINNDKNVETTILYMDSKRISRQVMPVQKFNVSANSKFENQSTVAWSNGVRQKWRSYLPTCCIIVEQLCAKEKSLKIYGRSVTRK